MHHKGFSIQSNDAVLNENYGTSQNNPIVQKTTETDKEIPKLLFKQKTLPIVRNTNDKRPLMESISLRNNSNI